SAMAGLSEPRRSYHVRRGYFPYPCGRNNLTGIISNPPKLAQFEKTMLPHLKAAYNLARWLLRNDADGEDVVQEAYLRAFRFFDGFHGGDGKSWLLTIVRNACRTSRQKHGASAADLEFNEDRHESHIPGPEERLFQKADVHFVRECIDRL